MPDYSVSLNITAQDLASSVIGNVNSALSGLATAAMGAANGGLSGFNTALGNVASGALVLNNSVTSAINNIQGLMGSQFVQGAVEMYNLGASVNATQAAFDALAGTDATDTLNLMRTATSGLATDFQLMQAANRYFSLGIAETGQQAAELTDMAITLGRVMGQDTASSIEAFGALLANQSIPRLDNFGISSARVRERVDELKQAGMDAQEAFTMAVLEQGRLSLERLGDAADSAVTPVARLSTTMGNFVNSVAQDWANTVNEAAGTIEMIGGIIDAQSQLNEINNPYGQFGGAAEGAQSYLGTVIPQGAPEGSGGAQMPYAGMISGTGAFEQYDWVAGFQSTSDWLTEMEAEAAAFGAAVEAGGLELEGMASIVSGIDFAVLDGAAISANLMADGYDKAANSISDALISAQGMYDLGMVTSGVENRGSVGDTLLFSPEEAQYASEVSTYYSSLLADATLLHEQGLISDTELANVQSTADAAASLADQAERGAQAFENMTLSQAFGMGGPGGMQGEIANDVTSYMQQSGASEADMTQWGMAIGTETLANMAYEQTIIPMITDIAATYGAEAGAAAIANVEAFLQNARMTGMSDAQIAQNMGQATGYEYAYQQYDPSTGPYIGTDMSLVPADNAGAGGSELDVVSESMTTIEDSATVIATQTDTIKAGFEGAAVSTETMADNIKRASINIAALSGRSVRIRVDLDTTGMEGVIGELIRNAVNANGGQTPGGGTDDHPGTGGT